MKLSHFFQQLEGSGITLSCEEGNLKVAAPKGALTPVMKEYLQRHKQVIVAALQGGQPAADSVPPCLPDDEALHEPFPLADLQQGFFLADDPYMEFHVRPHYYLETDFTDLDIARYEAAYNKSFQRHFRDVVVLAADHRLEVVANPEPIRCRVSDLRALPAEQVQRQLAQTRAEMMRRQLPLDRWPWLELQVSCWRDEQGEHQRVHYNHNNFFCDGLGLTRLMQEVGHYYRQPEVALPPLSLGFRDAVCALERMAESPAGDADRRYWEQRIPDLPGPPSLPQCAGMNRRVRSRLERREFFLSAERWSRFKDSARQQGLTPSVAVFAAYAEVLAAWSNQDHFVLSNMVTRRLKMHPEIFDVIGNFASLYPLEIDFRPGGAFAERARRIQSQVLKDTQHLRWGGMQVMQSYSRHQGGFGKAAIPFVVGSGLFMDGFDRFDYSSLETSQVMLDHQFWELPDGRYYYVWDLLEAFFPAGVIDAMSRAYLALITRLADEPSAWHEQTFMLTPESQVETREAVCLRGPAVPEVRLESGLLHAEPDAIALRMSGHSLTYGELHRRSSRIAERLTALGVRQGEPVVVAAERGPEFLSAVYGILCAGGAYVPVDPALPLQRRHFIVDNSRARWVLVQNDALAEQGWPDSVQVLNLEREVIPPAGTTRHSGAEPVGSVGDLAYVIYTSGSTGVPKGVMIDHRGAMNTILDLNQRYAVGAGDRLFGVSSNGFDLSVYDIFGSSAAGATLVYPEPDQTLNASHWLDLMLEQRITVWNSAPPLGVLLADAAEMRGVQLPDLRLVFFSGDWIPLDLPERIRALAPNALVISMGGATEASIWSILYEIDSVDPNWKSIPYGYPMANQSWFILDKWGRPVPDWTAGDLYIGGVGLALGYWDDEEKTRAGFLVHPATGERIYRTGDIGRYHPGGLIEFLGRNDSQVKIQGHRIELGEIESVLLDHPEVQQAVLAVYKPEGAAGVHLVAYLVGGTELTADRVREYLAGKLPDYMVPHFVMLLEQLPLSNNGKIDRKALPDPATAIRAEEGVQARAPENPIEERLLQIWRAVLKNPDLGVTDDFFRVGGQSFEAVQIVSRIREAFGVSMSIGEIWRQPTIARLAALLAEGGQGLASEVRHLAEIRPSGEGVPLFLVHPAGGSVLCYRELGQRLGCPVHAFQAPGLDERSQPLDSIEAFVDSYLPELVARRPEGPVYLGGWSSGGLIAYALAVELERRGREVVGVVIIDTPPPVVHDEVSETTLVQWFLGDLGLEPATLESLCTPEWFERTVAEGFAPLAARMRSLGVALGEDARQLELIYRVFRGIVHASRRYRAPQTDLDLMVVRARLGVVGEFAEHPANDRADWGWSDLSRGEVTCADVDGSHYTLLALPAIDTSAALISQWFMEHEHAVEG